jgi:hypothetical protein
MSNPNDETRADMPAIPPPPPGHIVPGMHYPPPPANYYPPLPPPAPQLPDFKPHRMSLLDKILMWVVVFVLLVFGLIIAAHFLLKPVAGTPAPHATTSSSAHHAATKAKAAACPSPSSGM